RDSSTLLAVAARVAREEGLEPPIAATNRFPRAPATFEDEWQEVLIERLGIADWIRVDFDAELDLVGPVATRMMARHGQVYPPNAHALLPLLERAGGGTLVNGIDGDVIFGGWWYARLGDLRSRRTPSGNESRRPRR